MNYYDGIAKGYNRLYRKEQLSKWSEVKERFELYGLVLDAGCGTGFVTEELDDVVGVDESFKMLRQCSTNLRIVQGCLEEMPFKNGVFDNILCLTVLQDVKNEIVSIESARTDYGVEINEKTLQINFEKTKVLRQKGKPS